jgi:hypothetical protein
MPVGSAKVVVKTAADVTRVNPSPDGGRFLVLERMPASRSPSEIRVVLNWGEELELKMSQAKPTRSSPTTP